MSEKCDKYVKICPLAALGSPAKYGKNQPFFKNASLFIGSLGHVCALQREIPHEISKSIV